MKKIYVLALLSCLLMLSACDSYLDIRPVGSVIPQTAEEYRALLARAYLNVPNDRGWLVFVLMKCWLMIMNMTEIRMETLNVGTMCHHFREPASLPGLISIMYFLIANQVIESQKEITEGTPEVVNQLVG